MARTMISYAQPVKGADCLGIEAFTGLPDSEAHG